MLWMSVLKDAAQIKPHFNELFKGELVAGLGQLLDDLSDPVARQLQISGSEQHCEFSFTDEPVIIHIWKRRG